MRFNILKLFSQYFGKNMDSSTSILPPKAVSKMVNWQPELFKKTIEVPYIVVDENVINNLQKKFKPYFLKVPNLKYVQENITRACENANEVNECRSLKRILINPEKVQKFEDFAANDRKALISDFNIDPKNNFGKIKIQLDHTNYHPHAMLKGMLSDILALPFKKGTCNRLRICKGIYPFTCLIF